MGCKLGAFCGDTIQQAEFGESCDIGPGSDGTCNGCRRLHDQLTAAAPGGSWTDNRAPSRRRPPALESPAAR